MSSRIVRIKTMEFLDVDCAMESRIFCRDESTMLARFSRPEDADVDTLAELGERGGGDKRVEDGCKALDLEPLLVDLAFDNGIAEPLG
jgi:hypothetical protein